MFDKLFEAQQKAGEVKKRLDGITVSGSAEGGKITVTANGNKVIQSINIDEEFLKSADKEELEELLIVAINKALVQAENVSQSEMAALNQRYVWRHGQFVWEVEPFNFTVISNDREKSSATYIADHPLYKISPRSSSK